MTRPAPRRTARAYRTIGASWIQRTLSYPTGPWLAEPGLLRVQPGATPFDHDFEPNMLGELTGGRPITGTLELLNDHQEKPEARAGFLPM